VPVTKLAPLVLFMDMSDGVVVGKDWVEKVQRFSALNLVAPILVNEL
jgi:hypothetical protein